MQRARGFNLQLLGVVGATVLVFFMILALGSGSGKNEQVKTVRFAVASRFLVPGTRLAKGDYVIVDSTGWPPKFPANAKNLGVTTIAADKIGDFQGRLIINARVPGDVLSEADFFNQRERGTCSGSNEALPPSIAPSGSPTPEKTATPVKKGVTNLAYAYRLTDLLCDGKRALVLEADPTASFARPGDWIELYLTEGGSEGGGTRVVKMMARRLLFVIQRLTPSDPGALNSFTPSGTVFVLDLSARDVADILYAQSIGRIRVALARPDECAGTATGDECTSDLIFTDGASFQSRYLDIATPEPTGGDPFPVFSAAPSPSSDPFALPSDSYVGPGPDDGSASPTPAVSIPPAGGAGIPPKAGPEIVALMPAAEASLSKFLEKDGGNGGTIQYSTTISMATLRAFYTDWAKTHGNLSFTEPDPGYWVIGAEKAGDGLGVTVFVFDTSVTVSYHKT